MSANPVDVKALHSAAEAGDLQLVSELLSRGVDVNSKHGNGRTALHVAAWHGQAKVVAALLERGADVNSKTTVPSFSSDISVDATALHRACENGHSEVVSVLLSSGADVHATDKNGRTALHVAAWHGQAKVVSALLERGADVNSKATVPSFFGDISVDDTALHRACENGHSEVVSVLLSSGADVHATDKNGRTALHLVSGGDGYSRSSFSDSQRRVPVVAALLARGANIHKLDHSGNTALHLAAKSRGVHVAEMLLRAGGNPLCRNDNGETPLSLLPPKSMLAEQMSIYEKEQAELCQSFSALASESQADKQVVSAEDAIPMLLQKLQVLLDSRGGDDVTVTEDEIEDVVIKHMNHRTGQVSVDAFMRSFCETRNKWPTPQPEPRELRERFRNATGSKPVLRIKVAKPLLHALFEDSNTLATLSFMRTRSEWNDSEVDTLLKNNGPAEDVLDEEGFVAVGMKVLFVDRNLSSHEQDFPDKIDSLNL